MGLGNAANWTVEDRNSRPYPNFSICGIPYLISGDVTEWHKLAHRSRADIEALGVNLMTDTTARHIEVNDHHVVATGPDGGDQAVACDQLVVATGAVPPAGR